MKVSTTLLQAMIISATIGISTGCTTRKSNSEVSKTKIDRHQPMPSAHEGNCPACGRG